MVEVKLVDLCKYFGPVKAVDHLNLHIKDREFVALLGPSGCGKTTTLLMIAGIYKPTSGYIYFGDEIVNDVPPKDRNVGMVFQSYALYPHMTVFDNIAFPLKLKKVPKQEIEKKVKEVAEFLRIAELLDRKPSQLSGGQQQRVALARALAKEPQIFLMDEPLSNLDAKLRIMMRAELKRMQKELGITTIYVTHDQVEAMTMADRIAVLNLGRLQQYGTPDELYNKPSNVFVAGFIGSPPMNFIDGSLVETDDKLAIDIGPLKLPLPE
ncbi:MAG: glycerol-3-phosphate ABC transporter ATP-binding protein, partial [Thermoprotei archaeon]